MSHNRKDSIPKRMLINLPTINFCGAIAVSFSFRKKKPADKIIGIRNPTRGGTFEELCTFITFGLGAFSSASAGGEAPKARCTRQKRTKVATVKTQPMILGTMAGYFGTCRNVFFYEKTVPPVGLGLEKKKHILTN